MSLCEEHVSKRRQVLTAKTTEIEIYQEEIFESINKIQLTLEKEHFFSSNSEASLNGGQYCYNQQLADQISKLTDPFPEQEQPQTIGKYKDLVAKSKHNKEETKETRVVTTYGLPNSLFREIQEIVNDVYVRNFRANNERKFYIFDSEHQFFIQQYNNQNKSKVRFLLKRYFRSLRLSHTKKNVNTPLK